MAAESPPQPLPLTPEIRALILARESVLHFSWFVRAMWPVIEPATPLEWNWHHEVICEAIQGQLEGRPGYRKLLIEMPPGYMKSVLVSVMRPAWAWLTQPSRRSLYFSCSDKVTIRDSRRTRDLVQSPEYGVLKDVAWKLGKAPRIWELRDDQNVKINFHTDLQGSRETYPIGSDFTGVRADDIVLDDLIDVDDVLTGSPETVAARMREMHGIVNNKVKSRVNNKKTACWTLIMQALGVGDPADMACKEGCSCLGDEEGWHHIRLPLQYDPDDPHRYPKDPRRVAGELIQPSRDGPNEVRAMTVGVGAMDPIHFQAQYNQKRISRTGGLYGEATFAACPRYTTIDPGTFTEIGMSIDCTFKKTAESDRVAMHVWGRRGWGRRTLLDRVTERMTFLDTIANAAKLHRKWGPTFTLVEDKANGPAAIEALQDAIPGLIAVTPSGSKYERTQVSAAPLYAGGQVELPTKEVAPWIADFEHAHVAFVAGGTNDDDIDAESQIHDYWNRRARQAPWLDLDAPGRVVRVVEPAWSTPDGGARHYVHTAAVLASPRPHLVVAVVPPAPGAPDGGNVGAAVAVTSRGEIVGHAEGARADELAAALHGMVRSLGSRTGRSDTKWARFRLVGQNPESVAPMARALRDYGLPIIGVTAASDAWAPKPVVLSRAADLARELASLDALTILDPALVPLLASATLNEGVPETPRIRLVEHRWMRKPVGLDAMLVAALAALDVVGSETTTAARQHAREEAAPKTERQLLEEHYRRTYGPSSEPKGSSLWAGFGTAPR